MTCSIQINKNLIYFIFATCGPFCKDATQIGYRLNKYAAQANFINVTHTVKYFIYGNKNCKHLLLNPHTCKLYDIFNNQICTQATTLSKIRNAAIPKCGQMSALPQPILNHRQNQMIHAM